jgi:hypothetical protein
MVEPAAPAERMPDRVTTPRGDVGPGDAGRCVTVIVPCRNERRHIDRFIDQALAQRLPPGWRLQLLVADGASDDGTAEQLAARAAADARIGVLANPARIVSAGLNRALAAAAGEVIVRMDVHTRYADDYVHECLAALARTGAANVGGPWVAEGEGGWGRAIAAAFQCRWVAGGALSRQLDHEGPVDSVYLGCWPRGSFERFGGFDEQLVRNQDDEHNLRLRRAGALVWQSGRIRSWYRPRDRLGALWRQWLQYGYWKPFVMRKHGQPASWRHAVPALFVAAVAAAGAAGLALGWWGPLAGLLAAYAAAVAWLTVLVGPGDAGGAALSWRLRVGAVIATHHIAYGIGTLAGAWDALRGRAPRERFGRLTR